MFTLPGGGAPRPASWIARAAPAFADRNIPVAHHLKEIAVGLHVLFRNRNDQPQIAPNEKVFDLIGLLNHPLDGIHLFGFWL